MPAASHRMTAHSARNTYNSVRASLYSAWVFSESWRVLLNDRVAPPLFEANRVVGAGEMALTSKVYRLVQAACPIAVLTLASLAPAPARADVFDGMRRTFQTDIPHFFQSDVPHFFQDDIPCAFGGRPTSHTRTSCESPARPAEHAASNERDSAAVGSDRTNTGWDTPSGPDR